MNEREDHMNGLLHEALSLLHRIDRKVDALTRGQRVLIHQGEVMATNYQDVLDKVTEMTSAVDGVEALLEANTQMLRDALATGDPALLEQAVTTIVNNTEKAKAAVVANTLP